MTLSGPGPTWAAFQDGNGAWTLVQPTLGTHILAVKDGNGRYGLAVGFAYAPNANAIEVFQSTLAEMPGIKLEFPSSAPVAQIALTGSATGLSASETASGAFGLGSWGTNGNPFQINCQSGKADLVVSALDATSSAPLRMQVFRGLSFSTNTTLPATDLNAAPNLATAPFAVTNTAPGITPSVSTSWTTAGGTAQMLGYAVPATGSVQVVPPALLVPGDLQTVEVSDQSSTGFRYAMSRFVATPNSTQALPSDLAGTFVAASGGLQAQWNAVAGVREYVGLLDQSSLSVIAIITPGWVGGGSALTYAVPSFQSTAGPGWDFTSGSTLNWSIYAFGSNYWINSDGTWPASRPGDSEWGTSLRGSLFLPPEKGQLPSLGQSSPSESTRPSHLRLRSSWR